MGNFQNILQRFFPAAEDICNEILHLRPDLVIGLMHSGRLPLVAGMELWQRTQDIPFPPVAWINLGREKMKRYNELENRPRVTDSFVGEFETDDGQAFFQAWLCDQIHWQQELQEIIRETIGDTPPGRILIVDELICEGSTYLLTLGLLYHLYPDAKVRFYSAEIEYKHSLFEEWAGRFHPELLALEVFSEEERKHLGETVEAAAQMALGTEDLERESLRWRRIEPSSPTLAALSAYLPGSAWMTLPRFVEQTIIGEIAARAVEFTPNPRRTKTRDPHLEPGILILREMYRRGPLTVREVSQILGWSLAKARYRMDGQVGKGNLVAVQAGRVKKYALSPKMEPDYWDKGFVWETYWVLPGRLLAGELPGYGNVEFEKETLTARLRTLLELGVTFFLDLAHYHPSLTEKDTYKPTLLHLASELQKQVHYLAIQTPWLRLPRAGKIQSILDRIDQALEEGYVVYIHDWNSEITETILGCYLVRHGRQGPEALCELERLRKDCQDGWRRAPAKGSARRRVRKWAEASL